MARSEGRGRAERAVVVAVAVALGLLALAPGAYAATYLVGGSTQQWNFASNGYSYDTNWVPQQTFHVNDVLEFKYSSIHDVAEYATKAEYDACSGTVVQRWATGDDLITLNSTGTRYYICSVPGHCQQGMKVSVNVVAASTAPGVSPASPPTTTPTPSPPGVTTPAPPPNAASSGPVLSMAGLLAAALAAGYAFLV